MRTFKTNPGGLVLSDLVVNEAPRTTTSRTIIAPAVNTTYTATYRKR